jgi:hypothetical protein
MRIAASEVRWFQPEWHSVIRTIADGSVLWKLSMEEIKYLESVVLSVL